jgi:hypothetical protein
MLQTHFSVVMSGDGADLKSVETGTGKFNLSPITENEALPGRRFTEFAGEAEHREREGAKWSSWGNRRSSWIQREYLLEAIRNARSDLVMEQFDSLGRNIGEAMSNVMSEQAERHPITLKNVRYTMPGVETVTVRRDVAYKAGDAALTRDVYTPPDANSAMRIPAVVIVLGHPDVGVPNPQGCQFKDFGMSGSWSRLLAPSGMIVIIYTTRDPATDVHAVRQHIRQNAASFGGGQK